MLFKSYSLIVDETYPDVSLLQRIADQGVQRTNSKDFSYKYSIRFEEGRFLLLAVDFDDGKYSETVFDTESETEKKNPRKRYELEYAVQFFACYDAEAKELYLSNPQRKSAIKLLFAEFIDPKLKVYIRERLTSVEEFAKVVQAIKRVKYTQTRNLVNMNPEGLFSQGYNPLGLEMPDKLISTLEYDTGIHAAAVIDKLKALFNSGKTKEIDSLEILGIDDEGFEQLFSLEKVVKSIPVTIEADEDGRYDPEQVFTLLLAKLKER